MCVVCGQLCGCWSLCVLCSVLFVPCCLICVGLLVVVWCSSFSVVCYLLLVMGLLFDFVLCWWMVVLCSWLIVLYCVLMDLGKFLFVVGSLWFAMCCVLCVGRRRWSVGLLVWLVVGCCRCL